MIEKMHEDCPIVRLIRAALERHNWKRILPIRGGAYIDGFTDHKENDGWYKLAYHVGSQEEQTGHSIAMHYSTGEIMEGEG